MTFNFVNASGQPVNVYALKGKHKPAKGAAPPEEKTDAFGIRGKSDGFVVVGYPPAIWASRITSHGIELQLHTEKPNDHKHPGTLDEYTTRWMRHNKPKRARSKPYELESAADQCAEMCRNAGWAHVRVDELKKA